MCGSDDSWLLDRANVEKQVNSQSAVSWLSSLSASSRFSTTCINHFTSSMPDYGNVSTMLLKPDLEREYIFGKFVSWLLQSLLR